MKQIIRLACLAILACLGALGTSLAQPVITQQPNNQTIELGLCYTNTVAVSNTSGVGYRWFFNGQALEGKTNRTLTFCNAQPTNAGLYSVVITNATGAATSRLARLDVMDARLAFTKTTSAIPLEPGTLLGLGWADWNNDGYQDLFVSAGYYPNTDTNRLYRNNRDGTFTRLTATDVGSIASVVNTWASCGWADYDNDGWLDVFVGAWGGAPALYRNNRVGGFDRILNPGLPLIFPGGDGVWGDYDQDGFVDVYAPIFFGTNGPTLYHNNGNGTFSGVTNGPLSAGLPGVQEAATWADYDNDGLLDLVGTFPPSSDPRGQGVVQFHNEGGGVFTRVTQGALVSVSGSVFAPLWADYDNDGRLDVLICRADQASLLLRNQGGGVFQAAPNQPPGIRRHVAGTWGDYDNDGDLDLVLDAFKDVGQFYQNNGDGTFSSLSSMAPNAVVGSSWTAWGDYDNDGFLDLAATSPAGAHLFHNNGNSNHWVMFKLEGTVANRAAIGAKVRVKATIFGQTLWQMREITRGFRNHDELRAHFGLGDATQAEVVRVEWPSGQVTEMHNVTSQQFLTIVEPPGLRILGKTADRLDLQVTAHAGTGWIIHASTHVHGLDQTCSDTNGHWQLLLSGANASRTTTVSDTNCAGASVRFYKAIAD